MLAALFNAVISLLGQPGARNLAAMQRTFADQLDRFLAHLGTTMPA